MFLQLDTVYRGQRNSSRGGVIVYVTRGRSMERTLPPGPALNVADFSPSGFEWGYPGSGPALLALAILLDFTQDRELALAYYHQLKTDYVADWHESAWQISGAEIVAWLQRSGAAISPDVIPSPHSARR